MEHLSYSSINAYLLCARSWWLRYHEHIKTPTAAALIFGSAVHAGMQQYAIANYAGNVVQDPAEIFAGDFHKRAAEETINWGADTPAGLEATGRALLSCPEVLAAIDALRPLMLNEQLCIEKKVTLRVPGVPVPIIGYIDMIAEDGIPMDIKTSGRKWGGDKAAAEMQPLFYLAALNQEGFALNPEWRFRHYVLVKTAKPALQILETKRTITEVMQLFQQISDVYRAIRAGAFPANTTSWKCSPKWCEFWSMCQGA